MKLYLDYRKGLLLILISLSTLLSLSCSDRGEAPGNSVLEDPRDGALYTVVKIGDQIWFAENVHYNPPGKILNCYNGDADNCYEFGGLYTAEDALTVCPKGWHLPSVEEYQELIAFLGGATTAGTLMKPGGKLQGKEIGFDLKAAGRFESNYYDLGVKGYYWTSTPDALPGGTRFMVFTPNVSAYFGGSGNSNGYSCRCIKGK